MEQPIRPCKLCLETKMLEDSHFMPQFIYKYCRTEGIEPIRVIADVALSTSRQIHDYLLCKECEDILNKGGESWMAEKLATVDGKFPLHDLVASGPTLFAGEEYLIYYGIENPEVRSDMIMHFAMGIFWKASVHSWIAGRTEPWIDLKEHSERIRLFLRGGEFPEEVALNVVLSTPEKAYIGAQEPYQAVGDENRYFMFSVPGIWFNLIVGKNIPHCSQILCLSANPGRPIVISSQIAAKSKEAGMMGLERVRKTESFEKAMKKVKKIKDGLE